MDQLYEERISMGNHQINFGSRTVILSPTWKRMSSVKDQVESHLRLTTGKEMAQCLWGFYLKWLTNKKVSLAEGKDEFAWQLTTPSEETMEHVFLNCQMARSAWREFQPYFPRVVTGNSLLQHLNGWWINHCHLRGFLRLPPILIGWELWKSKIRSNFDIVKDTYYGVVLPTKYVIHT
ncbi:hypothetical protein ACH5RR_039471 [Cinchona calisaya]|uniref:Reverse transcriptase zinc-binding domain-containing protein n=1 Tax=Cinchona calisaya TaxID=153742 RepID=A0ABD2XZP5_9GENT